MDNLRNGMACFAHTRNESNWENLEEADETFASFDELVIEKGYAYQTMIK
jgi:hypothetical protein